METEWKSCSLRLVSAAAIYAGVGADLTAKKMPLTAPPQRNATGGKGVSVQGDSAEASTSACNC